MLTWLYVPGDRPERFAKAVASGADVVVIDLEDGVHPSRKNDARAAASEFAMAAHAVPIQVRVNAIGSAAGDADLSALAPLDVGIRLPKVQSPGDIAAVAGAAPGRSLHPLLESALGVERAYDIATAHEAVGSIGLGEADLKSDLGVRDEPGLAYARSRVVLAARAAGLPPPAMSVYADVRDLDGLAASCRAGRSLGFLGRAAIHPAQLPVIVDAFRPSPDEVETANELLAGLDQAGESGRGVVVLDDGRFADVAMVRLAQQTLELARRYPA
jgi:citrate lyase subunit beta / citryl-CoA lyase